MRTVSPQSTVPGIRGELAGDEVEQGGLPRPVAAHDAHPVVPGDVIGEVPEGPHGPQRPW